jgi:hypothetical protein
MIAHLRLLNKEAEMLGGGTGGGGACANRSQRVLRYAQEHVSVRCSLYESVLRRNGTRLASSVLAVCK